MRELDIPLDGQGNRFKVKRSALFADAGRGLREHGLALLGGATGGIGVGLGLGGTY